MTPTSPSSSWFSRTGEWFFRGRALRTARAARVPTAAAYQSAVAQAKLLIEVARRVAEPVETLPNGARPAVLAGLYRDAVFWGLTADQLRQGGAPAPDLTQAWAAAPPERLLGLAGDEAALAMVRAVLIERVPADSLNTTVDDAARARAFADAIVWDLDAPHRAVERVQVQRWTRLALALAVVAVAVVGVRLALRGPNLIATKVFKTSSAYPDCTPPNRCGEIFFHTVQQDNPWIDFDLGAVKSVHRVEVTNRSDCCQERAIPLVIEVSVDDKQWIQVARRDADFSTWEAHFPKKKARYVRLRVPRASTLHFDDVVIR